MSVSGKKKGEWVAVTLTDFAETGRRHELRHHYTSEAAYRSWEKIFKTYKECWRDGKMVVARVWQETREGDIINDSQA